MPYVRTMEALHETFQKMENRKEDFYSKIAPNWQKYQIRSDKMKYSITEQNRFSAARVSFKLVTFIDLEGTI